MAATTQIYKVHYHFEFGGKKSTQDYIDYVSASANDFNSIRTVLSNNNRLQGGALVIDAVMGLPTGSVVALA